MNRIGIICPSEIAFRRFLPALLQDDRFEFAGIGIASTEEWYGENVEIDREKENARIKVELEKAQKFIDQSKRGQLYMSYNSLVSSGDIDSVYIPLPPSLHFKWAKIALDNGKHVFLEKPFTTHASDTADLIRLATNKKLAVHENYMFIYHKQLEVLNGLIKSGEIGDVRLYRITFGFPKRDKNDFRYNKDLGGGALIDAGGYTVKYASFLLGPTAKVVSSHLNYLPEYEVDMYGTATMVNDNGETAQLAFGMDCDYKCDIEIWGSKGTITSTRVLTAPVGLEPEYTIKKNQEYETKKLPSDDAFLKSIGRFYDCINNDAIRIAEYHIIQTESELLSDVMSLAK